MSSNDHRIQAENDALARVRGLLWEWESSQGDLGNDTFPVRSAAQALRAALDGEAVSPDVSEAHARRVLDREPPARFTIADDEPSIPPAEEK